MARVNSVTIIGTVVTDLQEVDPRTINGLESEVGMLEKDNKKRQVLNFYVRCFDEEDQRPYTLPVAVWDEELSKQCLMHVNKDDLIYIQGELRYKFIYNKDTRKREKIYTTIKASTIEFISKKMKGKRIPYSKNEVQLIGNLVNDPNETEEGFVIAVDRLHPAKEVEVKDDKRADYVTLVVRDKSVFKSKLKKGSVAIVSGKLMTRKKNEDNLVKPRIVVDVKEIAGR